MRQYVLVIIIVVGFLLFTSIVISLCIIFCKSNRFRRPRRVSTTMRVQPSSATPISVLEMAPKQSFVHLPPPSYEKYDMRTRSLAPSVRAYSNDYSFDRELFKDVNDVNWSAQPERSLSTVTARSAEDRKHSNTFTLRPKRSTGFVDRDPPSAESKSDYLDPLDFGTLHQVYSECQLSSEKKRPQFKSIECIYREDHRHPKERFEKTAVNCNGIEEDKKGSADVFTCRNKLW